MCKCAWSSYDILDLLNEHRKKDGQNPVEYSWMMVQHRSKIRFFKPIRKIGLNYIWDEKTARKIVLKLKGIPYRPNLFSYKEFRAGRCDEKGNPVAA